VDVLDVSLVAWIGSLEHAAPDSLADFVESDERLTAFGKFAETLSRADWESALALARGLNYKLGAINEAGQWFVVASDASHSGKGPVLIVSTAPQADVIFEAPHVPFETGTGEEASLLLSALKGRAVLIAGAHRCASRTFAGCSGRTAVCGRNEGYRNSDVGHNPATLFNAAHIAFAAAWPRSVVVSLHGMREDADGPGPRLVISNGIHGVDPGQGTAATRLRLALEGRLGPAGAVVDCNYPPDDAFHYRKLCGFTNVQGRQLNGAADTCLESVDSGSGRFIHLEQGWSVLKAYAERWRSIYDDPEAVALRNAFASVVPPVQP
jgi:hypothetical protein